MVIIMVSKIYSLKIIAENQDFSIDEIWQGIEEIKIKDYLWMQNKYKPEVIVKACYSKEYIYVKFLVFERKVTVRYFKGW